MNRFMPVAIIGLCIGLTGSMLFSWLHAPITVAASYFTSVDQINIAHFTLIDVFQTDSPEENQPVKAKEKLALLRKQTGERHVFTELVLNGVFKSGLESWKTTGEVVLTPSFEVRLLPNMASAASIGQTFQVSSDLAPIAESVFVSIEYRVSSNGSVFEFDQPLFVILINDVVVFQSGSTEGWQTISIDPLLFVGPAKELEFAIVAPVVKNTATDPVVEVRKVTTTAMLVGPDTSLIVENLTQNPNPVLLNSGDVQPETFENFSSTILDGVYDFNFINTSGKLLKHSQNLSSIEGISLFREAEREVSVLLQAHPSESVAAQRFVVLENCVETPVFAKILPILPAVAPGPPMPWRKIDDDSYQQPLLFELSNENVDSVCIHLVDSFGNWSEPARFSL